MISITGKQDERYNLIFVEDDGVGMTPTELRKLNAALEQPLTDEIGTGTWNVHQRLKYQFGGQSGLSFEQLPNGDCGRRSNGHGTSSRMTRGEQTGRWSDAASDRR